MDLTHTHHVVAAGRECLADSGVIGRDRLAAQLELACGEQMVGERLEGRAPQDSSRRPGRESEAGVA
jgi:hypothetical protein